MPTLRRLVLAALGLPLGLVGAVPMPYPEDDISPGLPSIDGPALGLVPDVASNLPPPSFSNHIDNPTTTDAPEVDDDFLDLGRQHTYLTTTTTFMRSSSSVSQVVIEPTDVAESVVNNYIPKNAETSPDAMTPSENVKVLYASLDAEDQGEIEAALVMGKPTIVLEAVEGVDRVSCDSEHMYVTFKNWQMYKKVLEKWEDERDLVIISNHGGQCDDDNQRGFYEVMGITGKPMLSTVQILAYKVQISEVVRSFAMDFESVPAGEIRRRFVAWKGDVWSAVADDAIEPSRKLASMAITKALDLENTLYEDEGYINIVANEAHFSTSITFSGKLSYSFLTLKLEQLYMDIDVSFDARLDLKAEVYRQYTYMMEYSPAELFFSMVNVPGILEIGPGVRFSIGTEVKTGAAVNMTTDLAFKVPEGKIHLDFLNRDKTYATGWSKPEYHSSSSISDRLNAELTPSVELAIELSANLFYGLINLSTGIKITPQIVNSFEVLSSPEELDDIKRIKGGVATPSTKGVVPYRNSKKPNKLRKTKSSTRGRRAKAKNRKPSTVNAMVPHNADGSVVKAPQPLYDCGADLSNGVALKTSLVFQMVAHIANLWAVDILQMERPMIERCWSMPVFQVTKSNGFDMFEDDVEELKKIAQAGKGDDLFSALDDDIYEPKKPAKGGKGDDLFSALDDDLYEPKKPAKGGKGDDLFSVMDDDFDSETDSDMDDDLDDNLYDDADGLEKGEKTSKNNRFHLLDGLREGNIDKLKKGGKSGKYKNLPSDLDALTKGGKAGKDDMLGSPDNVPDNIPDNGELDDEMFDALDGADLGDEMFDSSDEALDDEMFDSPDEDLDEEMFDSSDEALDDEMFDSSDEELDEDMFDAGSVPASW
ncbi:hypothetical protein CFO_g5081 [Ceratocystis platani]|uniref:DUF7029 domain-containing protein n=1 Tax=Ceratocystis fimbriata f. sp. platani TaxID=88771 RepID=A0A0F8AZY5_CERFI|nr:hypothetical protein CFO_g5081 [Ceratocystis platani]